MMLGRGGVCVVCVGGGGGSVSCIPGNQLTNMLYPFNIFRAISIFLYFL